jgi:hypothetical protein
MHAKKEGEPGRKQNLKKKQTKTTFACGAQQRLKSSYERATRYHPCLQFSDSQFTTPVYISQHGHTTELDLHSSDRLTHTQFQLPSLARLT